MLKPTLECIVFAQKRKRVLLDVIAKIDLQKYPTAKNFATVEALLHDAEVFDSIIEHLSDIPA